MKRILEYHKNRKGITIVLVALLLAVLLMFLGLAVDIAYMYFVKNQLQAAADAAALAGASQLDGTPGEPNARAAAWRFACRNTAGLSTPTHPNKNVFLIADGPPDCNTPPSDLNSGNDPAGDIVTGNWDPERAPDVRFLPVPGTPSLSINAVKVVARRTLDAQVPNVKNGANQVSVFVGQIFRMIPGNQGWAQMNAVASAIASRPPRMNASLAICTRTCDELSPSPSSPVTLYWAPYPSEVDPGNQGIAWSTLSTTSQSTPTQDLENFFCGEKKDACDLTVYSSNGNNNAAMRQFRCAFKNPLYDSRAKTCADGTCDSATDTVTSWKITVPVFSSSGCPPGSQPQPYLVERLAVLTVTEVYAAGGGGTNSCACGAYDASPLNGPNAIVISGIQCTLCSDITNILGDAPALVR